MKLVENMLRGLGPTVIPKVATVLEAGGNRSASAANTLRRFGKEAAPALPALVRAVRGKTLSDGMFVATVEAIGVADPKAMAELRRIVQQAKDGRLRLDASRVLLTLRS